MFRHLGLIALVTLPGPLFAQSALEFVAERNIAAQEVNLLEPSGLASDPATGALWIVDDDAGRLFRLTPDGTGPVETLPFDHGDLEGLSLGAAPGTLLAIIEDRYALVTLDLATGQSGDPVPLAALRDFDQVAPMFDGFDPDKGLEGITVDAATGQVFVAKEAGPRLLLRISPDLGAIERAWVLSPERGFSVEDVKERKLDIAGLAHDPRRGAIWMVSDTGRAVFLFDLATERARAVPIRAAAGAELPDLADMEGIAVDPDGAHLYIVTDDGKNNGINSRLLTFAIR